MERFIAALFDRLWDELEHPLKEVSDKKGQVLDLMVIGVDGKYIGRKIGSRLCSLSLKVGKEKEFQFGFCYIVNSKMKHLLEKEGGKMIAIMEP